MLRVGGPYIFSFSEAFLGKLMSAGQLHSTTWQVFTSLFQIIMSVLLFLVLWLFLLIDSTSTQFYLQSEQIHLMGIQPCIRGVLSCDVVHIHISIKHHVLQEGSIMKTFYCNYLTHETYLRLDFYIVCNDYRYPL